MKRREFITLPGGAAARCACAAAGAFGLCLANARNDADFSKSGRLLEQTREAISSLAMTLSPGARVAAEQYASQLLTVLTQHLRDLTGGGEQSH